MALNASTMAASIVAAVTAKTSDPIFQARCAAGVDVTQELWEVICQKIIEHIKSDMTIMIPTLTVNPGITVTGVVGVPPAEIPITQASTSVTGTTQPMTLGVGQIQ